jgi:two-component sensor histidine kinase
VILSMIVHELATNAAKYGALSNDTGTVTLEESDGRKLQMIWTEAGGPARFRASAARFRIAPDRTQRA